MSKKKKTAITKNKSLKKQVKWKDKLISHMKRILIMEKSRYLLFVVIGMFIPASYVSLSMDNIVPVIETNIICCMVIGCYIIPLLIVIIHYILNKDITNGLWMNIAELYEIKDEYKRFISIKECIKNYKHTVSNKEIKDVQTNINVIEAVIERDNTFSVLTPIFITVFTAVFIDNDKFSFDILILLPLVVLVFIAVMELVSQLPKNAFVKKVITSIREEMEKEKDNK